VADSQALFQISTRIVDIFVDKALLTGLKATASAAFNKLLNQAAEIISLKINNLQKQCSYTENYLRNFANPSFVHN